MSRDLSLNLVLRSECCAPTCDQPPLEDLRALPLCMWHARKVFDYFDGFQEMAAKIIAEREPSLVRQEMRRGSEGAAAFRQSRRPREEQVYYILLGDRIKIGYSGNIKQRAGALRVGTSMVLATEPGGRDVESARHAQFAHLRDGKREDFHATAELREHIEAVLAEHGPPKITTWGGRVERALS